MPKKVDVIIPIYKPDKKFNTLIKKILNDSYHVNKVIVLQTIEDDEKPNKSNNDRISVIPIKKRKFNHGITRNIGVNASQADVVVFMTQDVVIEEDDLIAKLISPMEHDNSVAISYAKQVPKKKADIIEASIREFNYPNESIVKSSEDIEEMGIKTFFVSNSCAAYDITIFKKLGGFDNEIFAEDMMYAIKAINTGFKVVYNAKAQVIHSHSYTLKEQFKRNFDIGVLHKKHEVIFSKIKSESEGMTMVRKISVKLIKAHKFASIGSLILSSAAKFAGYRIGKLYEILPKKWILACTLNKDYFY
ncbi:MAG: glycosyltransferase family 2 protein [Suipraeoptans sp.]